MLWRLGFRFSWICIKLLFLTAMTPSPTQTISKWSVGYYLITRNIIITCIMISTCLTNTNHQIMKLIIRRLVRKINIISLLRRRNIAILNKNIWHPIHWMLFACSVLVKKSMMLMIMIILMIIIMMMMMMMPMMIQRILLLTSNILIIN